LNALLDPLLLELRLEIVIFFAGVLLPFMPLMLLTFPLVALIVALLLVVLLVVLLKLDCCNGFSFITILLGGLGLGLVTMPLTIMLLLRAVLLTALLLLMLLTLAAPPC